MKNKEKLRLIIKEQAYKTKKNTHIISRRGKRSNWLMDLREVLLNAQGLDLVTDLFWDKMQDFFPFQIAGEELSSVPLIAALLQKGKQRGFSTNGLIIRKERKKSGLCKKIEGKINDLPIVLVDDLTNGATAFQNMYDSLEMEGKQAKYFFTIIDFQNSLGKEKIKEKNVEHFSLFKLSDFDLKLNKKKNKNKVLFLETNKIMSTVLSVPDYFYKDSYKSLLKTKRGVFFLVENSSLYSLNLEREKVDLLYDSKVLLPQSKKSNIILDKKDCVYWVMCNSQLVCFSLKEKKIKWIFSVNDFQNELKKVDNFLVFIDKEEGTGDFKLIILLKENAEIHFEYLSKAEISFFLQGNSIWIYSKGKLEVINLKTLISEEQFNIIGDDLELIYVRQDGQKIFMQNQQKVLIYNQENELIFEKDFSLITSFFVDEEFLCVATIEKQLKIYNGNKLKKMFNLHNANIYNFCRENERLYFSSNYAIFFIDLNLSQKYCLLRTVEKVIFFSLLFDSKILVHLAGNHLSYLNFHAKK